MQFTLWYGFCSIGSEDHPVTENESTVPTKKTKNKKQVGPDIDFTKALAEEMPDIFAPPKNPKSLLMPANRAFSNTKLPEDCHYQPENLVRLFLLPNVMVRFLSIIILINDYGSIIRWIAFLLIFSLDKIVVLVVVSWKEKNKVLR